MYREHFGFTEHPFALTPNPAFLFLSRHHQEALAHLLYGIESRAGFIELSGEVGTGKTTVIRTFLNQLDPRTHRTALIFNPTLSPLGLLQGICREFGLPCTATEKGELIDGLDRFLLDENRAGRTVVLVIDEAQNLAPEVLEQIRLISNLETERAKLIQIVLVGQPELKRLLGREELRQLDQRITVRYHLEPMNRDDTREYIRHRIRIAAGGREPVVFAAAAVKRIFRFSGGLPRLINAACDRALLLAYTREAREVSAAMAAAAIADVAGETRRPRSAARFAVAAALLLAIGAGAAATALLADREKGNRPPPATTAETARTPAQGVTPLPRDGALAGLAARLQPGRSGREIESLQELLKGAGCYAGEPSGTYDGKTREAVRAFQRAEGLDVDGRAGEKTLLLLYRRVVGGFPAVGEAGVTTTGKERK
ncbi:ExeA family protein [Geobacter sp.]|uniref:ExeA family protein n=1 Tax=Geobacter sp. TaxID=46610 RepID=UPI0026317B8A|nr:ExeA family protein [Geobacter sp.]